MPEPIRLENGYGCYCPDCLENRVVIQADGTKLILVCECPCHTEEPDPDDEDHAIHDDTCDCNACYGDEGDEEDDQKELRGGEHDA
jgi:hypothetical protein